MYNALQSLCVLVLILSMLSPISATEKKESNLVEVKLKYPPALIQGTPPQVPRKPTKTSEAYHDKKPAKIKLEKGVKLVSLNKPVTSSDDEPIIGELEYITDGEKEGFDGNEVELNSENTWVQIDLLDNYEIHLIQIWHFFRVTRAYKDVIVQVADDEDFIVNVRTLFNNDYDMSSGMGIGKDKEYFETNWGKSIKAKGETARYVRLYSNGSTENEMNHYIEVEVYGKKPVQKKSSKVVMKK